ncbi:MAG: hypothetical protein M5U05_03870 [Anaerolineales bacterium]|nr:hypothetical protein [Anaerolineales bacterium]
MANSLDRLYQASPVWLQQSMVSVYGLWWRQRRFSGQYSRLVREYRARERWSSDQFSAYQRDHLIRLLLQARQSPYYRSILDQLEFQSARSPEEVLPEIPLLSKEVLREQPQNLLTESQIPRRTLIFKSSGTTGTPTEIYYTPEFHALELAVPEARNLGWAGLSSRDRRVMFGVRKVCRYDQDRPPFWRFSPAENMAYASIYHLSPRYLPDYLRFLREYRPAIIMGYPSALYTVARFALEHDDLPAPARGVFTTSETVTVENRRVIEEAWQCKIYDRYGAVEGCLFAAQCEFGRYHVSPEVGIIEILDPHGQPCAPGEMGEVICTGLQNALQPLIRYRIGDVARWAVDQDCACRRQMPILEAIEGRFEDLCLTPDGREMLRFDTVFKGVTDIREAQVVQKAVDHFVIHVVPSNGFNRDDVDQLTHNFRLHAGDVPVEIVPVSEIPRSPSGKFRAVICEIPEAEKRRILQGKN